jgi:hypothetical protein
MKNHGVLSTKSFQNSACTLSKKIAHFCQMEVTGNCWIIDWNVKCNVKNIFTLRQAFSIMLAWSAERLSVIVVVSERRPTIDCGIARTLGSNDLCVAGS